MSIRIVMLGDIVGRPGRLAVAQQLPVIRQRWQPDLIVANAENASNGSGLTPELYQKLIDAGLHGLTLGDHCYRKAQIVPTLERADNLIRPANLPAGAKGRGWMRLTPPGKASVYAITVLGRLFMNNLPCDEPFAAVESAIRQLPEREPIVLVEIHAEATSEKQALGWHLADRVAAVLGTHTHVATADARLLTRRVIPAGMRATGPGRGTAYITDLGMCGPQESVLGRMIDRVLTHLTTAMPAPFDVAEGDPRVCGAMVEIDEASRLATAIERIELLANPEAPPFTMT